MIAADGGVAVVVDAGETEAPTRRHLPVVGRGLVQMVGQRFGALVVVERAGNAGHGGATWLCRCDCGATLVAVGTRLRQGDRTQCRECYLRTVRRDAPAPRKRQPKRVATRGYSLSATRVRMRDLMAAALEYPAEESAQYERPQTRGDCLAGGSNAERPCPWVSCAAHLALDVNEDTGSVKITAPDDEVWEMAETCALDVADRGAASLEDAGGALNLTRERIRQIEARVLDHLRRESPGLAEELVDPAPDPRGALRSRVYGIRREGGR